MSQSASKISAYELNLLQIEQTNDLLHSIENKLNDVFQAQTPVSTRQIDFNRYMGFHESPRDLYQEDPSFNIENNPNFMNIEPVSGEKHQKLLISSEKHQELMRKYDKNYDFPKNIPQKNDKNNDFGLKNNDFGLKNDDFSLKNDDFRLKESPGYHSSIKMAEDVSVQGRSLYSVDLKTKEELDMELRNLQKRLCRLERENELKNEEIKTSRQKILFLESSLSSFRAPFGEKEDFKAEKEARSSQKEAKKGENGLDFGQNDFNYAKIQLLEGKIGVLNAENRGFIREKSDLLARIYELERELSENQRVFSSFEAKKREYESEIAKISQKNDEKCKKLEEEVESLKKRLDGLLREKEDSCSQQKRLEKEKNKLNSSYASLLSIHNQMLQMDIVKNEKNLQNSLNESNQIPADSMRNQRRPNDPKTQDYPSASIKEDLSFCKQDLERHKSENQALRLEITRLKNEKRLDSLEKNERFLTEKGEKQEKKLEKELFLAEKGEKQEKRLDSLEKQGKRLDSLDKKELFSYKNQEKQEKSVDSLEKQEKRLDSLEKKQAFLHENQEKPEKQENFEKLQEYVKSLENGYKAIELKYNEQLSLNAELKTNWRTIEEKNKQSYEKIEKIYRLFCESQAKNPSKSPNKEKIVINSCPISTKSGVPTPENKTCKSMTVLMKTKKAIGKAFKPEGKPKRSNSRGNKH